MKKTIKMKGRGNRPDVGEWEPEDILTLPAKVADELCNCGLAKEVAAPALAAAPQPAKDKAAQKGPATEVKSNGKE